LLNYAERTEAGPEWQQKAAQTPLYKRLHIKNTYMYNTVTTQKHFKITI